MFASAVKPEIGLANQLMSAQAQLASQERQIQELNHRIANSLQLAADMLVFEQLRAADPRAQAALEASRARLVAVAELHRYLYEHANEPRVELRPFFAGLCQAVSASTGLACTAQTEIGTAPGNMVQQLAIAVNELAINAAKHAYAGRPGGRFMVTLRREGDELVLTAADEGKGLGAGAGHTGLGMSILAAVVRDLRGSMTVESDRGARFTIRVPLPAPPQSDRSFQGWNLT